MVCPFDVPTKILPFLSRVNPSPFNAAFFASVLTCTLLLSPVELLELADDESELAEDKSELAGDESELAEDESELIEERLETILLSLLGLVLLEASVDARLDELLIELFDELLDAFSADPAPQPTNKQAHKPAEMRDTAFINVLIANSIEILFLPSPIAASN